jgi:phage shock protein A
MNNEVKAADERAKKAVADAARLADELRAEQEHSQQIEKFRKGLEGQIKELQVRLEEAEAQALKGGKKMIAKLEQRVSISHQKVVVSLIQPQCKNIVCLSKCSLTNYYIY